jgi:UDP-glucose 6-dehydrogenase
LAPTMTRRVAWSPNLYEGIDAPLHVVATGVAEMLKYACNAYHGLKVGFCQRDREHLQGSRR